MQASVQVAVLLALSLVVGLLALSQNHCPGLGPRGLGGRTRTGVTSPVTRRRGCSRLVINIVAAVCIINAIVAFTAPQRPVHVEVPISQPAAAASGSPKAHEELTTTGAGAALILALLATVALITNANYIWHLYTSGRRRVSEQPLPLGAPLAAQTYILGFHALPWLGYVARDQISMRRSEFSPNLGQDAATWGLLLFFLLQIGLHVAACCAAAAAFARQARALRRGMERVALTSTALAALHKLQFRAIVYAIGGLVLYLYIFGAFFLYPYNLQLATLLLLLFCFPPRRPAPAAASGGAQQEGGEDGMYDLCVNSPATMEMQEAGANADGSQGRASSASDGTSQALRVLRTQL